MNKLDARIMRGRQQWGDKFDTTSLFSAHPTILAAFESGERVRVRTSYGENITGTVSTTTGWKPSFLLMRRRDSRGSSDLLGADDQVIAVKFGRSYVSI